MRKILYIAATFGIAFTILVATFLKTSSVSFVFAKNSEQELDMTENPEEIQIDYTFIYPGKIAPDNTLWIFKAFRDRLLLMMTTNPLKRAEKILMYSDKRIVYASDLFEREKPELALETLMKSEQYLFESLQETKKANENGLDTAPFLRTLALASLKHRYEIEQMLKNAPEKAKPEIIKTEDVSKNTYKDARDLLNSKSVEAPKDPFEGL